MDDNSTISIKDLIQLYLQHLWVLIISLIVGGGAAYAYTHFLVAPQYSSHISMYVQTYIGITDENSYNDISKSKQLINTYIQVLFITPMTPVASATKTRISTGTSFLLQITLILLKGPTKITILLLTRKV